MKNRRQSKKPSNLSHSDLPKWPGEHRFTPGLSTEEAFKINEEFQEWASKDPRFMEEWRNQVKCQVEFKL